MAYKSAKALGIKPWERKRLIEFSKAAPALVHISHIYDATIDGFYFNLNYEARTYNCKTVACIGGFCSLKEQGANFDNITEEEQDKANDYVNKDRSEVLNSLYYPQGDVDYDAVTPTMASEVVKHFLRTGEIDWSNAPTEE